MRVICRLFALCCALAVLPSLADSASRLYQVREPVASEASSEQEAALRQAFDTLLLRLTGDRQAARQPAIAALRKDPQQLISSYVYEDGQLVVDFDPATTQNRLRQAGLSLWGASRPAILVWWLSDALDGSQLIGDGQDSAAVLRDAAQHRGLPLRLPLADLGEQLAASAEALGSQDLAALREPSERYEADVLLAVHARETDSGWQAGWRLRADEAQAEGKVRGDNRAALADAVMLAVSEFLAPRYTVAAGASEEITLEVLGADVSRFVELEQLLEPFGGRLLRVEDDRLVYRLKASPEQLRAQLALARLQPVPAEDYPQDAEPSVDGAAESLDEPQPALPADAGLLLRYRW